MRGHVSLLVGALLVFGAQGIDPVGAKDIEDVRCPSTTTTTSRVSTTTTTLDPLCVILGTDGKTKKKQIAAADEVFLGDISSEGNAGGCLSSWEGSVLLVVNDGKVTKPSLGFVETSGLPGCSVIGGSAGTAYTELFQIRGRVSGDRVRLRFLDPTDQCLALASDPTLPVICWGVSGGAVTRDGSEITGSFTTNLGQTTFETTVDLGKSF